MSIYLGKKQMILITHRITLNTPKNKYENINENNSNNQNKKTEPYVVINNNKQDDNTDNNEEFSELVFIDIGKYLNNLND